MPLYRLIAVVIAVLVISLTVVVMIAARRSLANRALIAEAKYPPGYWMSIGLSVGVGIGLALGVAFDNLAIGLALGAGIGTSLGAVWEQKNKAQIRPLTEEEQQGRRWGPVLGLMMLMVGLGVFFLLLFLSAR